MHKFNPADYEEHSLASKVYKKFIDCQVALHDYILSNIAVTEIERSKLYSAFIDSLFEDEPETSTKWNDFFCKAIIKRNNKL